MFDFEGHEMVLKKKVTNCSKNSAQRYINLRKKEIEKYLVSWKLNTVTSVQCKNNKPIEHAKKDAEPYK